MTYSFRRLALAGVCLGGLLVGSARAGGISVTNDTNAADLVSTLIGGGTGGITVTGYSLSANHNNEGQASTGIYNTNGPNNYNLTGPGIVLSSGNAASYSSGPVSQGITTAYVVAATPAQAALLTQVSPKSSNFYDVSELTVNFTAGPNTDHVFFKTVFASAEYPNYVGTYIDAFGLFLNGKNIAFAGGQPVNIDNSLMVNTSSTLGGGNVQPQYQETALQGLLVGSDGDPFLTYGGPVIPGSKNNTLTFIVADSNDSVLDTAVFIKGLGNAPPTSSVPEPASMVLMGLGAAGLALLARCHRSK
jgi:hypothetical protein